MTDKITYPFKMLSDYYEGERQLYAESNERLVCFSLHSHNSPNLKCFEPLIFCGLMKQPFLGTSLGIALRFVWFCFSEPCLFIDSLWKEMCSSQEYTDGMDSQDVYPPHTVEVCGCAYFLCLLFIFM